MNRAVIIIFLILIFYIGFVAFSDLNKISNISFNFNLVPLILLFTLSSFVVMGIRQFFLLKQIGITISVKENIKLYLSGLSMVISPGGSGQLIKSYYIKKKYNHEINKTLPLVFVEKFIDLICITTLIISSLLFVQNMEIIFLVMIIVMIIVVVILTLRFKKLFTVFVKILSKTPFFKKFVEDSNYFYNSLNKMISIKSISIGFIFGMLSFSFDAMAIYFVFMAFNVDLHFFNIIASIYPSILYGSLSFIPGGVGVTELSAVRLLTDEGISTSLSSAIILTIRFATLWFATLIGFTMTKVFLKN